MAPKHSTGLRNFLLGEGSVRKCFEDGVIKVYSGAAPASADAAIVGTLLCVFTKDSQPVSADEESTEKQALIDITVAGVGATVIVAINGVDYTYTVLAADDTLRKVARKVARMLHKIPEIEAIAAASGDTDGKVAVKSRIAGLSFTIAKGGGGGGGTATWSLTDNTIANARSDALQFGAPSNAVMQKASEVWSGVVLVNGTAGYFRLVRPSDDGAQSTLQERIQGSISTSGADMNMSNVNLAAGATETIENFSLTIPASKD